MNKKYPNLRKFAKEKGIVIDKNKEKKASIEDRLSAIENRLDKLENKQSKQKLERK